MTVPDVIGGAVFSDDQVYRYTLWRTWDEDKERVMFIGLNPSTADAIQDDPTIRRCIRFAKDWGYGGLLMANLYALRSTDPKGLNVVDPVGPFNDDAIVSGADRSAMVVVAWGAHGRGVRVDAVVEMLHAHPIYCLGKTKSGAPRHPLYLRTDTPLEPYWTP